MKGLGRKIIGFVLLVFGIAIVGLDVHVAYLQQIAAHWTNIIIGTVFAFAGGYVMVPTIADALADAILKRIPALASLWPGGMRRTDPPADPNVPPPPSVTGGP
jgi:hypothetical protein